LGRYPVLDLDDETIYFARRVTSDETKRLDESNTRKTNRQHNSKQGKDSSFTHRPSQPHDAQLTNNKDRSINRKKERCLPPILRVDPSIDYPTNPCSSMYASSSTDDSPSSTSVPRFLPQKDNHTNKKKDKRHKERLFRLRSLRASDSAFTDPKRVSGGSSNDNGVGYTYAEHAGRHERPCSL